MNLEAKAFVWDTLAQECGARRTAQDFVEFAAHWPECREYRFQGTLGFGGKVWWSGRRVYVTCYREDETLERTKAIERANDKLAEMFVRAGVSHNDAAPGGQR